MGFVDTARASGEQVNPTGTKGLSEGLMQVGRALNKAENRDARMQTLAGSAAQRGIAGGLSGLMLTAMMGTGGGAAQASSPRAAEPRASSSSAAPVRRSAAETNLTGTTRRRSGLAGAYEQGWSGSAPALRSTVGG